MIDTLESADAAGLIIKPLHKDEPTLKPLGEPPWPFDTMIRSWLPLTLVLNNLNRGLGLRDVYPFFLPNPVLDKLRFVHEVITETGNAARPQRPAVKWYSRFLRPGDPGGPQQRQGTPAGKS
jgi:hypothetical protein